MKRRFGRAAFAALAIAAIAISAQSASGTTASAGGLQLAKVAKLSHPIYVDAPRTGKLLFVVEQSGVIRVVRNGRVLKRPFVDLRKAVLYDQQEQGLYSIAFDPAYAHNGRFYVYYINNESNIEVDVLRRSEHHATRADAESRREVIEVAHPGDIYHNGGGLQFGPDGFLYIGTGDDEGADNQPAAGISQSPGLLLGKLLRVDPKPGGGYDIPSSNPFGGASGKPEVYATGLRNPYRFSFDSRAGEIYIADVGQDRWEEVDRVPLSQLAGANFGWDLFEGDHPYNGDGTRPPNYEPPIFEYSSFNNGNCAILGGIVVHDPALGSLDGRYLYTDFCGAELRSFDPADPAGTDAGTGLSVLQTSSFGTDATGHVYVTSLAGGLYRLKPQG